MDINKLLKFNEECMLDYFNTTRKYASSYQTALDNVIAHINGEKDYTIHKFGDCEDFLQHIESYDELVKFNKFYNEVGGDLSNSYFIVDKVNYCEIDYIKDDLALIEALKTIVLMMDITEARDFSFFIYGCVF